MLTGKLFSLPPQGTIPCMAPEQVTAAVLPSPFDPRKADMWAAGASLLACLFGKMPFQHCAAEGQQCSASPRGGSKWWGVQLARDHQLWVSPLVDVQLTAAVSHLINSTRPLTSERFFLRKSRLHTRVCNPVRSIMQLPLQGRNDHPILCGPLVLGQRACHFLFGFDPQQLALPSQKVL